MLAAMKCMISCQDLTFLKGMKGLSHLLECEPGVVGSNLVFQNGSWAPCYLYSLNKRAFFKLWEARCILCFFSIQNNLLLTTITLLPNIQVSKLSVKKGGYLLGFCKRGRLLFPDVRVFGGKGVKLLEGWLVMRQALLCVSFRFVADYYAVLKTWLILLFKQSSNCNGELVLCTSQLLNVKPLGKNRPRIKFPR